MKQSIKRVLIRAGTLMYRLRSQVAAETLPRFATRPEGLKIDLPRSISGADRMFVGDHVELGPGCFLIAVTSYPSRKMASPEFPMEPQTFEPTLRIGNRVTATAGLQIFVQRSVEIGDDVMFASNVFINDGSHGYDSATVPYRYQPITRIAPIRIGGGCWIGQNVVIMPGVTIGENALIGANSVVTRDIPPRSIAVGTPARVVKRWDAEAGAWSAVDAEPPE